MPATTQSVLRISGAPGTKFRVVLRTRGDEEVTDVAAGILNHSGVASVTLGNGYFVILANGYATVPVHIDGTSEVTSIQLSTDR